MGCDIHIVTETKNENGVYVGERVDYDGPLGNRDYSVFAFLADVRNYEAIKPISEPRGVPEDASAEAQAWLEEWSSDAHSVSWLSIQELLDFDYEKMLEDRRCTRMRNGVLNGGCACEPGEGEMMTYKEYLGDSFFNDIQALAEEGVDRIVFWFDN